MLRLLVLLPCETQHAFSKLASANYMYTQYINMDITEMMTGFEHRYFQHNRPTLGIFLDMNCRRTGEVINTSSRWRLFSDHYNWLIYDLQANITNFRNNLINANLSVDTDMTYAFPNMERQENYTNNTYYILYDVYNNGRHIGGKLNMTVDRELICNSSSCALKQYLSKLYKRSKYGNRNRLHDITMRVSAVVTKRPITWPHEVLQEFLRSINNTRIDTIVRFGWQVNLLTQDMLGCNMSYEYTDRWSNTETVGGSVGALINETVDIASTPFLCTLSRLQHVVVLAETGGFHHVCMFRTPRNSAIHGGVFLKPFSATVWLIFGAILLIIATLLWSTFFVEYHRMRYYLSYMPSILTTFLISFGSACVQSSSIIPNSFGGRIAFFSMSLITFIMYNYYTSAVVSSLLGTPVKSDIKTLGELADSSLEVGFEPLPYTMVYLNVSQVPAVRRLVKNKIDSKKNPQSVWLSEEEGIRRVRDEPGYVFVFEASTGLPLVEKYYKENQICDLNEILLRPDRGLYTQLHKNSTYKEIVRLSLIRLLESGVYSKHRRQWIREKLNCFVKNFLIDVGMEYTAPLFIMLAGAYLLVLIILLMEITYKRYKTKKLIYK